MPHRDFRGLEVRESDSALLRAVLHAIAAVPDWSLLPAELAVLAGPGRDLETVYRQGAPGDRVRAVALQFVAAADACPQPWPARTQRLQQAVEALRQAAAPHLGPAGER